MTERKHRIAARFDNAAQTYDAHSGLQRYAAGRLAGMIATASLPPRPRVLEVGCGTGHLTSRLVIHLPGASILATDIAPAMVAACQAKLPHLEYAVLDGSQPACKDRFDLVCANLAAQWFDDLPEALARLAALLTPGGLLALNLLGAATFGAWRAAHARLGLHVGTHAFLTADECRSAFPFGNLRLAIEHVINHPHSALDFLRALRAIGADTPAPGHAPLSPAQLRRVMRTLGDAPAIDYEIIFALWRPAHTLRVSRR